MQKVYRICAWCETSEIYASLDGWSAVDIKTQPVARNTKQLMKCCSVFLTWRNMSRPGDSSVLPNDNHPCSSEEAAHCVQCLMYTSQCAKAGLKQACCCFRREWDQASESHWRRSQEWVCEGVRPGEGGKGPPGPRNITGRPSRCDTQCRTCYGQQGTMWYAIHRPFGLQSTKACGWFRW